MLAVILASSLAAVSSTTNIPCITCFSTGRVDVKCSACKGRGYTTKIRKGGQVSPAYGGIWVNTPCSKCARGMVGPQQKGTGRVSVKCPKCNGKKYLVVPLTTRGKK